MNIARVRNCPDLMSQFWQNQSVPGDQGGQGGQCGQDGQGSQGGQSGQGSQGSQSGQGQVNWISEVAVSDDQGLVYSCQGN